MGGKSGFWFFYTIYPKKSGLSKILKVSTVDIRIKQSGLKVSHSKVPAALIKHLISLLSKFASAQCSVKKVF